MSEGPPEREMPTISRELFHWSRVPTGIEKLVCEDVANRQALGIAKYGQTVADNPLSLREWLQHGLEEALDMAVYLKRAIAEIDFQEEVKRAKAAPTVPDPDIF